MTIYSDLWKLDQAHNGARVVSRPDEGDPDPSAHVVLDEQVKADGRRQVDLAERPLFTRVDPDFLQRPTYAAFRRLLDNYVVNFRAAEVTSPEEVQEIKQFLDLIAETEVFKSALTYVNQELRPGLTAEGFWEDLHRMWFTQYTNYYRGRSTHYCSGFEHVFVGEGKFRAAAGLQETKGEVTGYHNWVKFYLDEAAGRVDFRGHRYDLGGGQGPDDVRVATIQLVWMHSDFENNVLAELFKSKGGFFVGSSPELEMVLGAIAFYESAAGLAVNDNLRTPLGDDGRMFDLTMYRNTEQGGQRGRYIRSFFPRYLGSTGNWPDVNEGQTVVRPVPANVRRNDGAVIIASALPNPVGDDQVGEWVRLRNTTDAAIDLNGWVLRDKQQASLTLNGELAADSDLQVDVVRRPGGFALGNKGGSISLYDAAGQMQASVGYGRTRENVEVSFAQLDDQ